MAEREYRRVTPWRWRRQWLFIGLATRTSLWLGRDHLLSINSYRYTEQYKRFYFRDIQAITIRTTKRRRTWNLVLGLLLLLWSGIITSVFSTLDTVNIVLIASVYAIFGVPLLVNNLLGPTCTAYIQTAVQLEELPSIDRTHRAQKVLNLIRPLIAAIQGEASQEELVSRIQTMVEPE